MDTRVPEDPADTRVPEDPADRPEPLHRRRFRHRDLRGSRFDECDLAGVVVRGSEVAGLEIDSPWLFEDGSTLVVNGVDVVPLVDAELDRRFPGRGLRRATTPDRLREAWTAVEQAWAALVHRAEALPEPLRDASVADEWSLAQTLRHLVLATDVWLGRGVLGLEQPYHPAGLPNTDGAEGSEALDMAVFTQPDPSWSEVLEARADRQGQVRDFLAQVDSEQLAETRPNPHSPSRQEDVRSCLGTILEEEWEHLRHATRDLDELEAGRG